MICVAAGNCSKEDVLKIAKEHEMIELRLDLLDLNEEDIKDIVKVNDNIIATCRYDHINDSDRMRMLKYSIDAGVKYIDVEIESDQSFKDELSTYAKKKDVKVIISYHNFKITPDRKELESIVESSKKSNADICKIACMANSFSDAATVLSMYNYDFPILSLGMGEFGKITRIAAVKLGAPFTFAAISEENNTAPGQISAGKIKEIMELIENA